MTKKSGTKANELKDAELDKVAGGATKNLLGDQWGDPRTDKNKPAEFGSSSKGGGTNV